VGGQSIVGGALRLARNAGGDTARADGGPGVAGPRAPPRAAPRRPASGDRAL